MIAAPIPALPPVTIAVFPASMSLLHGNAGSTGAGRPVGMVSGEVETKEKRRKEEKRAEGPESV